jgi:hypothetical protein
MKNGGEFMGFINFLRRVNRGIVLGIALIIGLACYWTIDNIAFKTEREAIRQVMEDYTKDMETFLLLPEQYREIGTEVPNSVIENKMEENKILIDKYFSNKNNNYGWSLKESVTSDIRHVLKNNQETGNKVKSYEAKLTRVKSITKHGSNLVTVEAVINTKITVTQGADVFNVLYSFGGGNYMGNFDTPKELSFSTQGYEYTITFEMIKHNGVWVFYSTEGMSMSGGTL